MNSALLQGLAVPTAVILTWIVVFAGDALREPHRDLYRPFSVVCKRDYRRAIRRIDKLIDRGEWRHVWYGAIAITKWLHGEGRYGSARRRRWFAKELQAWELKKAEFKPIGAQRPPADGPTPSSPSD